MNFRVEQHEDDLWMVQPASNSAILATGRTREEALTNFENAVTRFLTQERFAA